MSREALPFLAPTSDPNETSATMTLSRQRSAQEQTLLREVVETLAPMERRAGSPAERDAAYWIAGRLERAGCAARVEEEQFLDGYAPLIAGLTAAGAAAGVAQLVARRGRRPAALVGAAAALAIADDISNGPRLARRATTGAGRGAKTTWNVVAEIGDPAAPRTLVLLAHHDAAPTGVVFDDRVQRAFGERFPGLLERIDTSLPQWWPVVGSPAAVAAGALLRRRGLVGLGVAGCVLAAAAFADIARSPVVPGANDNLSAVATLVALAERLRAAPIEGLRVLLVSAGAEEVLQGGIHGFAARHFAALDRERTFFLNLETLGSPELVLLEGEGPVVMEDYVDRSFRDLVARAAERADGPVRRGMRSRASTDAVVPSRAGYPTATLASMDRYKSLSNYHRLTDIPENLDYETIQQAVTVSEAVARELVR
jgi:hypothetical protein